MIIKRGYNTNRRDGHRIVELMRKRYDQKKLEHINAAEKDKTNILTMNEPPFTFEYENKSQQGIYGLGYTSSKEV
jgi:hypothetical protein